MAALAKLAAAQPPHLVADLGSGTGISTVVWADHAEHVIGIEQNPEMLAAARGARNVEYVRATAQATGLPDECADIVTCAQSFHWMEPRPTISEIARILRPGGVFAAYDYDWPPLVDWQIDAAFLAVIVASGVDPERPEKRRHLERLRASRQFRWVREFFIHACEHRQADQIAQLPYVFGPVARRLQEGASHQALGLDRLQATINASLGGQAATVWWSYRVRSAVK